VAKAAWFSASLGIPQARPCIVQPGARVFLDAREALTPDETATIIAVTPDGHKVLERKLRKGDPGIDVASAQFTTGKVIVLTYWPHDPPGGTDCPDVGALENCGTPPRPPPPCIPQRRPE
jgi:hypothetical protein